MLRCTWSPLLTKAPKATRTETEVGLMRGNQKLITRSLLVFSCLGATGQTFAKLPICYIPGAGGGSKDAFEVFPKELAKRGIKYISFDIGRVGTVVERAEKLVRLVEDKLNENPNFKCHFYGFSMGGVVSRYFYHHSEMVLKTGQKIPASQIMVSLTTYSSPHRGTPLADWLKKYGHRHTAGMDDLSEESMRKYNEPSFVDTYSPEPQDIPVYSFQTYVNSKNETNDFLGKFGFSVIWETYKNRGLEPRNDGIVPLISQAFGKVLMTIKAPHGYFSEDVGLRPWAPDVFEAQYKLLNKKFSMFKIE